MISLRTDLNQAKGKVRLFVREWDGVDKVSNTTIHYYSPDELDTLANQLKQLARECRPFEEQLAATRRAELLKKRTDLEGKLAIINRELGVNDVQPNT